MSNFTGAARKAMLLEAKRQMYRNTVEFAEDNRPVVSLHGTYLTLNRELFKGSLPDYIDVTWNSRLRRCLGKAYYSKLIVRGKKELVPERIEIKSNHRWTNRFKRKVLIHEMCHIWAYKFHNEEGHGRHFWKKMMELGYPKTHRWDNTLPYELDIYS